MSEQARTVDALINALTAVTTAARTARNINRRRATGSHKPRHRINLDQLINTLTDIHTITTRLAAVLDSYAHAVRSHYDGGDWVTDDGTATTYPSSVVDAAAHTHTALTTLASQLRRTPIGPSQDALAALTVTVAQAHQRQRTH